MTDKIKEIHLGKTTFILDEKSGFWLNPTALDPMSATLVSFEVAIIMEDYINAGKDLVKRIESKLAAHEADLARLRAQK